MMLKHTPGPWIASQPTAAGIVHINAERKTIAQVWDFPNAEANARLIAAAPEMRAALTAAVAAMEAQEELVDLTALGDFSGPADDKRRSEIEMMNGLFVQELRALLTRIDGVEP